MKLCGRCRRYLPRDKFYSRSDSRSGLSSWCRECAKRGGRERREADPALASERQKRWIRKFRYGLSAAEYQALLAEQGGLCAICRRLPNGQGGLHVDHDHATGVVRGLLCASCNMGLGQFGDSPDTLNDAITYLHHGFIG